MRKKERILQGDEFIRSIAIFFAHSLVMLDRLVLMVLIDNFDARLLIHCEGAQFDFSYSLCLAKNVTGDCCTSTHHLNIRRS